VEEFIAGRVAGTLPPEGWTPSSSRA
jgi:hypothetical protein